MEISSLIRRLIQSTLILLGFFLLTSIILVHSKYWLIRIGELIEILAIGRLIASKT